MGQSTDAHHLVQFILCFCCTFPVITVYYKDEALGEGEGKGRRGGGEGKEGRRGREGGEEGKKCVYDSCLRECFKLACLQALCARVHALTYVRTRCRCVYSTCGTYMAMNRLRYTHSTYVCACGPCCTCVCMHERVYVWYIL